MAFLLEDEEQEITDTMGYADEFTTQSRFYTSDGLSRKVMSACEPFGNFRISLVEQSGKILLCESLGFQNLTNTLGLAENTNQTRIINEVDLHKMLEMLVTKVTDGKVFPICLAPVSNSAF